jgi:hypothetical protein
MHEPDDQAQSAPLRPEPGEVKTLPATTGQAGGRTGFARHFVGYELGLLSVGIALAGSALAIPRASEPSELPLPVVDRTQIRLREHQDQEAAARAESAGLSFDVRAVGEGIRMLGRALAHGDDTSHYLNDVRARAHDVLQTEGAEPLLRLRAIQTRYFLDALHAFERGAGESADLSELAGDFLSHARRVGWLDANGHCVLDESERRVLFALRWAELVGARELVPLSPTLDEWRVYYRFLLTHPDTALAFASPDALRIGYATALARKDPSYPVDLARGVLFYRAGDLTSAASALRRHLAAHADGPYALLARNYLIYTLQGGSSE